MTLLSTKTETRRDRRYASLKTTLGTIEFESGPRNGESMKASLLDLSSRGAKLSVADMVPMECDIRLTLEFADPAMDVTTAARTCWSRPSGNDEWWLGCLFDDDLPESALVELCDAGYIERRRDFREDYLLDGAVSWESSRDWSPATLTDVSPGGFSLIADKPPKPETRLLLWLVSPKSETVRVVGNVCWHHQMDDYFKFGCSFANKDSYPILVEALGDANNVR